MTERRFVLLDRDGTIIVKHHYLSDPDKVRLLPGAPEAMRQLRSMGLGLVVVTNQSAIGRGHFDTKRLEEIHARLCGLLRRHGVQLDGIYYCPHTPQDNCCCRKPKPGMIESAASDLNFIPRESFVIGDNTCDIELGRSLGAMTILVKTGCGAELSAEGTVDADYVVDDLLAATQVIGDLLSTS